MMKLYWPIVFVIVAIVAALLGFGDERAPSAPTARILSAIFLGFAALLTLMRMHTKRPPDAPKPRAPERRNPRVFRDML